MKDQIVDRDKSNNIPRMPKTGGVLFLLAGLLSLGLTTSDPTNPSPLGIGVMIMAWIVSFLSFSKKAIPAFILGSIFLVFCGIFAIPALKVHWFHFLIRGGISMLLALFTLGCLVPINKIHETNLEIDNCASSKEKQKNKIPKG